MERITHEQSKKLIPYEEDLINGVIAYFTLTPSLSDPGWEDVTYYTNTNIQLYSNLEGDGDSWVYVLSNPTMPGLLKIGSTGKDPNQRAKQISRGTGIPLEFEVEYAYRCFNAVKLERELHKYFKPQRINNQKEFFRMSLNSVKEGINILGVKYI